MSPHLVTVLLTWALPPALGAVIGYVTNDIAIRMLFRPLTEKRIFGIRLPLTPGVIPKQRYALAESIGRMVSEHLITGETVRTHLEAPGFRGSLRSTIGGLTERALATSPARLGPSALELWRGSLGSLASGILRRFFNSPGFLAAARSLVAQIVATLGEQKLSALVSAEQARRLVRTSVLPRLAEGTAARWARERVRGWVSGALAENTPVSRLLPEGATDGLLELLRAALPRISEALLAWLRGDTVRVELESHGRLFLRDVLERLTSLQRLFVSVAQYDKTLHEKMPEIVDDALGRLEGFLADPANLDRLQEVAQTSLGKFREKGLRDLAAELNVDLARRLPEMVERAVAGFDGERMAGALEHAIDRFFAAQGGRTLRELAGRYLGLQEHEAVEALANAALGYLTREETVQGLVELLEGFLRRLFAEERPIGELLGVDASQKDRLDGFLSERAHALLSSRLPEVVQSFNIHQMVVDRINHLDVAEVESLLMIVIAKHLKWINVFGALLGSLIGLVQSILSVLR